MIEKEQLNDLATHLESLLNQHKTSAFEIKVYSSDIVVSFDWNYDYGHFTIIPNKDGGYIVLGEYYTSIVDTIQQVADYLIKQDDSH